MHTGVHAGYFSNSEKMVRKSSVRMLVEAVKKKNTICFCSCEAVHSSACFRSLKTQK